MQYGRRLIESRPILGRIPADDIIVPDEVPTAVPGAGIYRFAATRDRAGAFAMVYAPAGRPFRVRLDPLSGPTVTAWWFNPRDGEATLIGEFPKAGIRTFMPPAPGEALDFVLVLDDTARGFAPPGVIRNG